MHHEGRKDTRRLDLQTARHEERGGEKKMKYITHHRFKELALCGERPVSYTHLECDECEDKWVCC